MDAKKIEEVPFEEVYEVEKYGTYYSENKFWQKVQRVQNESRCDGDTSCLPALLSAAR